METTDDHDHKSQMGEQSVDFPEKTRTFFLSIYREAVKNVHFLKYSYAILAAIGLIGIMGLFREDIWKTLIYTVAMLFVCFLCYSFSALISKWDDKYIQLLVKSFFTVLVLMMIAGMLGFGSYIFTEKPPIFDKIFKDKSEVDKKPKTDTTNDVKTDTTKNHPSSSVQTQYNIGKVGTVVNGNQVINQNVPVGRDSSSVTKHRKETKIDTAKSLKIKPHITNK
jgi:hypothetical protein